MGTRLVSWALCTLLVVPGCASTSRVAVLEARLTAVDERQTLLKTQLDTATSHQADLLHDWEELQKKLGTAAETDTALREQTAEIAKRLDETQKLLLTIKEALQTL
jgi:chromosome segregation ATPase